MNVEQRQAAADPQTKPPDLGCESACFRQLSSTTTIAIYYYYSALSMLCVFPSVTVIRVLEYTFHLRFVNYHTVARYHTRGPGWSQATSLNGLKPDVLTVCVQIRICPSPRYYYYYAPAYGASSDDDV